MRAFRVTAGNRSQADCTLLAAAPSPKPCANAADEGIDKPQLIDFSELHRSHPLVGLLAQHLLEDALSGERPLAARCAATLTNDVEVVTTLYLLRLRHQLSYVRRREPFQMMAEETVALAVKGRNAPPMAGRRWRESPARMHAQR